MPAAFICLSDTVYAQVRNKLEVGLTKLDSPELKHIEVPMDVYRVVLPWQRQAPVAAKSAAPSPSKPGAPRGGRIGLGAGPRRRGLVAVSSTGADRETGGESTDQRSEFFARRRRHDERHRPEIHRRAAVCE